MDYNRFSYYRANPFAKNDFLSVASMENRKKKQFVSEIPQGVEHYPSKLGKRIYKDKVYQDQIEKDGILNSPEKYPFQNRIALDKAYRRNLDTIDIQGASSGTNVSQSIKNKHKALEELRKRNQQQPAKNSLMGESLDQVYEKKRRELAKQIEHNIEMRRTKEGFADNNQGLNDLTASHQSTPAHMGSNHFSHLNTGQFQNEYERYVSHNSNKKYNGLQSPKTFEYQGFQRYKRAEKTYQTLDSYNNGRIPQNPPSRKIDEHLHQSVDYLGKRNSIDNKNPNIQTNGRGSSIDNYKNNPQINDQPSLNIENKPSYMNNSFININNRHRSNPQYVDNYQIELHKRIQQSQRNKEIASGLRNKYQYDRVQFRRNNPTNLSFNIAAKNSLLGPIV